MMGCPILTLASKAAVCRSSLPKAISPFPLRDYPTARCAIFASWRFIYDPDPPPLICIEEPELGLHPDLLPKLADHLVTASERTQLIVTTHSDILVDALTERPETVVVL